MIKVKLIAFSNNLNHPGLKQLERSLKHFDWDYEIITGVYEAYGSKQIAYYNYAKQTDCTHLFAIDAHDTFVIGTMEEAMNKIVVNYNEDGILLNAERACWPYEQWSMLYPDLQSPWRYLNGGCQFFNVDAFCRMFEANPIRHEDNDQVVLAKTYLTKRHIFRMELDNSCRVFQSISHCNETDFKFENGRLKNTHTHTEPVIIHGNGQTNMQKIYELLP